MADIVKGAGVGGVKGFIDGIMKQKQIDHEASHSNLINQWLHFVSSSIFIYCYAIAWNDYRSAAYWAIFSLVIRQAGHYIFEPPCEDKEKLMLGFDTASKVKIVLLFFVLPTIFLVQLTNLESVKGVIAEHDLSIADVWIAATLCIVFGRVLILWARYNFLVGLGWFIKLMSDPYTDLGAYYRAMYQIFNPKLFRYALHRSFPTKVSAPSDMTAEEIHAVEHGNGFPGVSVTNAPQTSAATKVEV